MIEVDVSRCKKCVYRLYFTEYRTACGYLYYTNKRRPCEPGLECTEFLPIVGNEEYRKKLCSNITWMHLWIGDDLK